MRSTSASRPMSACDRHRLAALRLHRGDHLGRGFRIGLVGDADVIAARRGQFRGRGADAAAGAGDEKDILDAI